jgi:hypothetical protein
MEPALSNIEIDKFINDGYIKIENAFSSELADEARAILWKDTGCDPNDPTTWTEPVIRLGDYAQEPFRKAANTPILHAAFNQLVGEAKWIPRASLGTFPIRFPGSKDANDTGWHVEASYPGENDSDYLSWRVNVFSKGRALLMLFLFSDVEEEDAPTRIRVGSHLDVAKILRPAGENGMSFPELAAKLSTTEGRKEVLATGNKGTVYLCHPFLVHAAQKHMGRNPRFMAQPPLQLHTPFILSNDAGELSPVELAIRKGISGE